MKSGFFIKRYNNLVNLGSSSGKDRPFFKEKKTQMKFIVPRDMCYNQFGHGAFYIANGFFPNGYNKISIPIG